MHVLTRPQVAAQGVGRCIRPGRGAAPAAGRERRPGCGPVTTISAQRLASVSLDNNGLCLNPLELKQNWVGLCPGARGGALRPWFLKSDS